MAEQITKKVDFFIIGAPKCGTTSLAEYLKCHPDIVFSERKEPHFFSTDLLKLRRYNDVKTFEDYRRLFRFKNGKMHGEASTTYLFSKDAVKNILEYNPCAKLIVMLRNPIDMAIAWHGQKLRQKEEDEIDFRTAWSKQKVRKLGQDIPVLCAEEKMLFYKEWCLLGEQIQRLFQQVPMNQCHVIFFDDFVAAPEKVYRKVLDFLELGYDGRIDFPAFNQYKECRNHNFDKFRVRLNRIRKTNGRINKIHGSLKRIFSIQGLGVQKMLLSVNYKKAKRKTRDTDFRKELLAEFYEDICLLERITGQDLSRWKR